MPVPTKKSVRKTRPESLGRRDRDTTVDDVNAMLDVRSVGEVRYEKGVTKHIGDGNYLKITVSITLPFNPTEDQLADAESTIALAEEIVDNKLADVLEGIVE
jgi:hypothetical protein